MTDSLALLSRQTGISIGATGTLPNLRVPAVHGVMEPSRALQLLLAGTSLRAVGVGRGAWRIEPRPAAAPPPLATIAPAAIPPEIIVTARKRREALGSVAAPVTIIDAGQVDRARGERDTRSVARLVDGLTVTNLGSGRNRLFVRGVADSPFDGFGQSSVSVQLDETRATYDAPDPDLRLIDLDQVELLKGPQGPLYGTGALGGVYRLVTNKPDLARASGSLDFGALAVAHGGTGGSIDAVLNLPLVTDRLGVRAVAYRVSKPGWIDNGSRADSNRGRALGGRFALRARPAARWTIDVAAAGQWASSDDSQYVVGDPRSLKRNAHVAEPLDSDFMSGSVTVRGALGDIELTSVSSLSEQESTATYDASAAARLLGATAPATFVDARQYRVLNQEVRLASSPARRLSWLAGMSLLRATTDAQGRVASAGVTTTAFTLARQASEVALFGEIAMHLTNRLSSTFGLRAFRASVDDERNETDGGASLAKASLRFSPSATLSWKPDESHLLFLRYASALRAGGVGLTDRTHSVAPYKEDELQTLDLGGRMTLADHRLALDGGVFASRWSHVQADFLRLDGLVTTHNAGDAVNYGLELSARWTPRRGPSADLGLLLQRARIETPVAGELLDDRRLPVVPDISAHAALTQPLSLAGWAGALVLRGNYVGSARLSFDPALDRKTSGFAIFSIHLDQSRGPWTVRLDADNLADSRADSFAFGNPFSVRGEDQHTPLRPRSLTLSVARHW